MRRGVAILVSSGAAVLAMAAPAAASTHGEVAASPGRGMEHMCTTMMSDKPGMETMREAMMRSPAMKRMCQMMMRHNPEMAQKCMTMMGDAGTQA